MSVGMFFRNGENIVHTVASTHPTAMPQTMFVNLITAARDE